MKEQPSIVPRGTLSIRNVAARLGIGANLAYELARTGRLPIPVIRLGDRRMVVSAAALDRLLSSPPPFRGAASTDSEGPHADGRR